MNFATNKYSLVQIDSTFCKVHKHGRGARKILGDQAIGVSRGGYNTKIHALVNEYFQLIGVVLTGGQIHDSECAVTLLSTYNLPTHTSCIVQLRFQVSAVRRISRKTAL